MDESDSEYGQKIQHIHKRCAERILQGCLQNGGVYVKFGQGLVNMDHLLPKEYIQTLKVVYFDLHTAQALLAESLEFFLCVGTSG